MRHLRLAAIAFALFAVAGTAIAGAATKSSAPKNLRAFLLRADEPTAHTFPRTPAFAWAPVSGARCYEFELATSKAFSENSLVWSNVNYAVGRKNVCSSVPAGGPAGATAVDSSSSAKGSGDAAATDPTVETSIAAIRVPAVALNIALPWFTGSPYALYAHVRAITANGATRWSKAFGFNMRWPEVPKPMASQPGLVRWTPVTGATGYQVWYIDAAKVFASHTNVADEREYYSFHPDSSWTSTVHWRVRAIRHVFGSIPNGLPAVTYGPWSPVYTAHNPALAGGSLSMRLAISDKTSDGRKQAAHELMPALTFSGTNVGGRDYILFRAYAFTDRDCVNMVFRGPVVGSPAYAPRATGPLKLPANDTDLTGAFTNFLPDANSEGPTYGADGEAITTNESVSDAGSSDSSKGGSGSGSSDSSRIVNGAKVDLPDLNFPTTRYYWTVVPVVIVSDDSGNFKYYDAEVPQDACAAGRIESFGKGSQPVLTTAGTPFVSGLSPRGRLLSSVSSKPVVYGSPLISWQPAVAASLYEVQWSRKSYPWNAAGRTFTYSTSSVLHLKPGTWHYRVRGINLEALKNTAMSWSAPVRITVAKPTFRLVAG
jgi:hypothetical protein